MRNLNSTRSTSYILKPPIRVFSRHKTNITSPTGHGTRSLLPGTKGPVHFDCWDRGTVEQCPSALPEVLGGITYTEGCSQDRRSRVWPSVGHILPQTSITSYAVFGIGQSKLNYRTHRCAYVVYCYCCNVSCIALWAPHMQSHRDLLLLLLYIRHNSEAMCVALVPSDDLTVRWPYR